MKRKQHRTGFTTPVPGFTVPDQPGAPFLDAYIDDTGMACVWCRYCLEWHQHGPYNGHRVAHCPFPHYGIEGEWVESPYRETGYNLRIHGPLTHKIRMRYEQRSGALSLNLRFAILKRDHYRCQICGRTAQQHGVVLEIDHRIPRAKGGSDNPSNLWTLCFDCNRGKSDSDL
jgi:hypothetical protein